MEPEHKKISKIVVNKEREIRLSQKVKCRDAVFIISDVILVNKQTYVNLNNVLKTIMEAK